MKSGVLLAVLILGVLAWGFLRCLRMALDAYMGGQ